MPAMCLSLQEMSDEELNIPIVLSGKMLEMNASDVARHSGRGYMLAQES